MKEKAMIYDARGNGDGNICCSIVGGSEVLVICSIRTPSEHCARTITKAPIDSMLNKGN